MSNEENKPNTPEERERAELQSRLEAARIARETARQQREELESKDALRKRVEAEERAALDEEALFVAEREHGREKIATVETDLGMIILKRANPIHFKRFQDSESVKTIDIERLVRPCVVYPDATRFDAICDELPATLTRCADRVATLAGVRAKELAGK
jgi:parvulin-like peptidyl-prolyl isomerase